MRYNIEHTIEIDVQEAFDELPSTRHCTQFILDNINYLSDEDLIKEIESRGYKVEEEE
jgi:hypothetical protein